MLTESGVYLLANLFFIVDLRRESAVDRFPLPVMEELGGTRQGSVDEA